MEAARLRHSTTKRKSGTHFNQARETFIIVVSKGEGEDG